MHSDNQKKRYENCVSTWLQEQDFIFYSDHEDLEKNIIKVSDDNTYKSNEPKFVNIVNNLPEQYLKYDWFLFCDNDTFVNTKKLNSIIDDLDENYFYGSIIDGWHRDNKLKYISGGAGKLISNKQLREMRSKLTVRNVGFADVCLGHYLRDFKKQIINLDTFKSQPPEHYQIPTEQVKDYVSFHYIKEMSVMKKLYKACQDE